MKKLLVLLLLVPLVLLLTGCAGVSAEEVMKDSLRTSKEDIKTVSFELEQVTKLPRAPIEDGEVSKQNFEQKASGEYDMRTGDFRIKTTLIEGVEVTMLQIDGKQYWQITGNWYEVPQAVQLSPPVTQALSVSQYLKEFKSLEKLGDTDIDGQGCYHIRGIPDMAEIVKQPGISDLLKDPTGQQIRTVDELEDMEVVFDFYILKENDFFKRSIATVESPAPNEFIKLGYAQPGDTIEQDAVVTFTEFNEELNLKVPDNVQPLPTTPEEGG